MHRDIKENDWRYDFENDCYYTVIEKKGRTIKVIIDSNDYSYAAGHE